ELLKQLDKPNREVARVGKNGTIRRLTAAELVSLSQVGEEKVPPPAPGAPGQPEIQEPDAKLKAFRDQMIVEEQKLAGTVEANIRQARPGLAIDPDAAYELIKTPLLRGRDHPDLSDRTREELTRRLQNQLRSIQMEGAQVKLRRAQEQQIAQVVAARRE